MNAKQLYGFASKLMAAASLALATVTATFSIALAQELTLSHVPLDARLAAMWMPELETLFWECDRVATKRGVHATPIELCSSVTEDLKNRKFGGDFGQMLEWWRHNKVAEHGRLAGDER